MLNHQSLSILQFQFFHLQLTEGRGGILAPPQATCILFWPFRWTSLLPTAHWKYVLKFSPATLNQMPFFCFFHRWFFKSKEFTLFFILKIRAVCKEFHLPYLLQESGFMSAFYFFILLPLCLFCWSSLKLFHFSRFKGDTCFLILILLDKMKAVYTIHQH